MKKIYSYFSSFPCTNGVVSAHTLNAELIKIPYGDKTLSSGALARIIKLNSSIITSGKMTDFNEPEAKLEALLDIINSSAHQAIAEYKKTGHGVPSTHATTFHPLDLTTDTLALKKAIRRLLEGAYHQLSGPYIDHLPAFCFRHVVRCVCGHGLLQVQ
ncbi:hypothetical protein F4604DRAFT_1015780 [Suillus subluteus]|nr:hypothetical protein F4604DRAFT_1015780 [Suillus subluteus]